MHAMFNAFAASWQHCAITFMNGKKFHNWIHVRPHQNMCSWNMDKVTHKHVRPFFLAKSNAPLSKARSENKWSACAKRYRKSITCTTFTSNNLNDMQSQNEHKHTKLPFYCHLWFSSQVNVNFFLIEDFSKSHQFKLLVN